MIMYLPLVYPFPLLCSVSIPVDSSCSVMISPNYSYIVIVFPTELSQLYCWHDTKLGCTTIIYNPNPAFKWQFQLVHPTAEIPFEQQLGQRSGATTIVFNLNVSGCIIFLLTKSLRSFSIFNKIEAVFHLKKLHLKKID